MFNRSIGGTFGEVYVMPTLGPLFVVVSRVDSASAVAMSAAGQPSVPFVKKKFAVLRPQSVLHLGIVFVFGGGGGVG